MKLKHSFIGLIYLLTLVSPLAFSQSFISENSQVRLIELYTSEGCSSCPPADNWLSSLKDEPGLWSRFIPVAFHVDYWDYIGWKDSFAQASFTQRQRQYGQQNNLSSIYTPAVMLNGQEWTSWRQHNNLNSLPDKPAGKLSVNLKDQTIKAQYKPLSNPDSTLILKYCCIRF